MIAVLLAEKQQIGHVIEALFITEPAGRWTWVISVQLGFNPQQLSTPHCG